MAVRKCSSDPLIVQAAAPDVGGPCDSARSFTARKVQNRKVTCWVFHTEGDQAPGKISLPKKARGRRAANEVCVIAPSDLSARQVLKPAPLISHPKKCSDRQPRARLPLQNPNEKAQHMSRTEKKIEALAREIEQKTAILSDLNQKAKEENRRADTRRKIIYGAAFLAYVNALSAENAEKAYSAVQKQITNKKDRQFLDLSELKPSNSAA